MPQATTVSPAPPAQIPLPATNAAPADVLRGARAARDELESQINSLLSDRKNIADRLREGGAAKGADLTGLEERIILLDKQLAAMYIKKAEADAAVVTAAAVPGAVQPPPFRPKTGPSEEEAMMGAMFIFFVLFPIAIAYARRIWRRSAKVVMGIPAELSERLNRLEESVDSVAIEVERVGEGQRFVTNLFMEGGPQMLGAGPMNTLEIKERERAEAEQRR